MPRRENPNFLEIPQTPRSKGRMEDSDEDSIDRLPSMDEVNRKTTGSTLLVPGGLRSRSASPLSMRGRGPPIQDPVHPPALPGYGPATWRTSVWQSCSRFWGRNRAVILVAAAQLFGALMNLAARLLEIDGEGMHPFQILFARMSITTICSCVYMYYTKVPHFPFGAKEVRILLIARGLTGFFGIYGLWWSMMYLPLAEATVITFLAPALAGYICHLILKDPFTRKEQLGALIALAGVVLIARPTSLFGGSETETPPDNSGESDTPAHGGEPSPADRLFGIGIALIGVLGASGAFTTIRWIGTRAHPLISVTYFSVWCTIVSTTALLLAPVLDIGQPDIRFGLPASAYQWALLLSLGLCGFIMQFMLTSGIGGERSNRATAMVYTHMLFAAGFDRWIFGHEMGISSLIGCGLIIGSAIWVALSKKQPEKKTEADLETSPVEMEEGVPMLGVRADDSSGDEGEDAIHLQRVR